jgi:hypothetical protein
MVSCGTVLFSFFEPRRIKKIDEKGGDLKKFLYFCKDLLLHRYEFIQKNGYHFAAVVVCLLGNGTAIQLRTYL